VFLTLVIFEGSLEKLDELNLNYNELTGTIPKELYKLQHVRFLKVARNNLEGSLASEIGNSTRLVELEMGDNSFTGTLPTEMVEMKYLELLSINNNRFNGTIPAFLGRMQHLSILYLHESGLTGPIPETFCEPPRSGRKALKRKIVVDCDDKTRLCSCCSKTDKNATVKMECYKESPWIEGSN
jgi:hypothetical protein